MARILLSSSLLFLLFAFELITRAVHLRLPKISWRMSLFLLMGLLTGIDYRSVPIFKNLSVGFCDLVFDPGSRQSIKYGIDTHGLVTRIDLLGATVTCRAAPWDLQQFEAALQLLLALKPILVLSFRLSIDG